MIPQDWQEKTLGEVCEIISGTTPNTSNDEFWGKGNYWITPAEINEGSLYINGTMRTITDRAVKCCSLRKMPRGTVLFSSRAPIGKIAISNVDVLYCNQGFKNFICSKNIHNKFLYYFLIKNKKYLISLGKGTTFKEVSKSIISAVNIQYPPLSEQERIVAKLDKAFEAIDKAKTIAETNLKNAKELFESTLNKAFTENTDGWEEQKLKDISSSIQYGYTESANYNAVGPKFLRITDIQNDTVVWDNVPYCVISNNDKKKYLLKNGDIVFARTGATVGKSYLIENLKCEAVYASYLIKVSINKNCLYPNFVKYFFKSNSYWKQIIDKQIGAGQPNVNGTKLGQIIIEYPSLSEQQKIVEKLDKLQEQTKQLEAIYTKRIKDLDELKQSILQKAFRGEL